MVTRVGKEIISDTRKLGRNADMEGRSNFKRRLNQMRLGQRCCVQQMGQWRILRDDVHCGERADCNRVRGRWELGERALIAVFFV